MRTPFTSSCHRRIPVIINMMQPITVDRSTLCKEVWEEPMLLLAKRYNISDVALAKVCRKLHVPVPPRGYWVRVRNGYKVTIPRLLKMPAGEKETATISPQLLRTRVLPEAVQEQQHFEAAPKNRIAEAHFNRKLHPLVQATKQIRAGKAERPNNMNPFNVRVSKDTEERAYRLLSALLHACEERGFSATLKREKGAFLIIKDEPLQFSLEEPSRRVTIPENKRKDSWSPTFKMEPTGKLVFRVQDWADGARKAWSDGAKRGLEDQLNEVICGLVDISIIVRDRRLEHARQQVLRAEQERQRYLYAERKRQLDSDVGKWKQAEELRRFVEYTQSALPDDSALKAWQDWVYRVAAQQDPLSDGVSAFLARYKMNE